MIEFSIENLIDVNIAMINGNVVYMVNGESVSAVDFTAIMAATQVLMAVHDVSDDEESEPEPNNGPFPPPFGG